MDGMRSEECESGSVFPAGPPGELVRELRVKKKRMQKRDYKDGGV